MYVQSLERKAEKIIIYFEHCYARDHVYGIYNIL